MSDTLRRQLLGLGFKEATPAAKPRRDPPPHPGRGPRREGGPGRGKAADARSGEAGGKNRSGAPGGNKPRGKGGASARGRDRGEIELAKAYAIRAQKDKDERIAAEKEKQEQARLRREARTKLAALVEGKALNAADAEIARHFDYGGKIKRIYVTGDQLKALNGGELGVLQLNGRYLLVSAALLVEAEGIFPEAVALKVDPDAPATDAPYSDPKYQVPDDLVW